METVHVHRTMRGYLTVLGAFTWLLAVNAVRAQVDEADLLQFRNVSLTIDRLLQNYDIRLRPSFGDDPLKIGIEVILASFDSISEVNMAYVRGLAKQQPCGSENKNSCELETDDREAEGKSRYKRHPLSNIWMVCQHTGKPFALHHVNQALYRRMILDGCLKAYAYLRADEVMKMVSWRVGKPFPLQHISRTLHRRMILDQSLKAYSKSLCADEVLKCVRDYTITMYLNQYWRDERLQFSQNDNESLTLTGDFAERIWVPDTFLANDKSSFLHDVTEKNKMVRLFGNGSLVYGMRFTTTLACMMDLHNYPLDHQQCTVEIESYGYTMDDIELYWLNDRGAITGVEDVSLPQFSVSDYETLNKIEALLTGDYQRLSLNFKLQRNIGYFIFQTYLPSILIVMLSWVSFWINHEATSARVALGITTVLTMTTISNGVRSSLPRISYVKAIDIYLVMCFVFVFAALLEYAAVNYTYWGARAKRKAKKLKERSASMKNPRRSQEHVEQNNSVEAMEMKEIRLSPMLGIRNSQSFNMELDGDSSAYADQSNLRMPAALPRSTYVSRGYLPSNVIRRRSSNGNNVPPRRRRLLSNFKQKAKQIKVKIPRVQDVNTIDRYARLFFPLLFVFFNVSYWAVYLLT